ncbi:MAG TPA: TRAP transporter substrate-binding protein, partial [Burkholderiales bacterium]
MKKAFSLTVLAAAAAVAFPAAAQAPAAKQLKMQSTWPASLTLQDNFRFFADRMDKLTGGQVKIEALAAGQIVPAFEILDATHKKVIDGGHGVSYYWVGKNKAATLFSATPVGPFGMDHFDFLGWLQEGGGQALYDEFYRDILKLSVIGMPVGGSSPQAMGWFKRPIKDLADFKGMKCRQTGIVAEIYARMGMQTVNMPGGEIIPSAQRGVIDCAEWVGGVEDLRLGLPQVWKYHYTPGMHESASIGELIINTEVWASLTPQQQEAIRSAATETFV